MSEIDLLSRVAGRGAALEAFTVLYAGANLPMPDVLAAYQPALSAWPAMGPSFHKEQPGTDLISELEVAVRAEICTLFGANWAEPRLPSCTMANLAVFHAFARPGDLMLAPAAAHGGHLSQRRGGTPELAGLKVEDLPFDAANVCLDAQGAVTQVLERRPRLVMLGRSVVIRPDDIAPVIAAAHEVGAKVIFDASHVLGLIAGGRFPNPLALGADLMTSSTYKTLPGRPHSIIAGRLPQDGEALATFIDRRFIANGDAGRLPQMLMTLRGAALHGAAYAARITAMSEALAGALRQEGVGVLAPKRDFTHQILVPLPNDQPAREVVRRFEAGGILVGSCADPTRRQGEALRIGTQFITREQSPKLDVGALARQIATLLAVRG